MPVSSAATRGNLEAKIKYLEFIQNVIARMSNSSFLFKGWAITVAAGLSTFAATSSQSVLHVALAAAIVSSVLFWGLDGYYLWIECRYRELYKRVIREQAQDVVCFSMDTDKSKGMLKWLNVCRRPHLVFFYGLMLIGEVVGLLVIKGR
jgi:hypothetical protein